jgi:hypothetical protein
MKRKSFDAPTDALPKEGEAKADVGITAKLPRARFVSQKLASFPFPFTWFSLHDLILPFSGQRK